MAPTLRSDTRRQSEAVEAMRNGTFKVPPPHLPFEVRQVTIDEYIDAALVAMPNVRAYSDERQKRAAQVASGVKFPSLCTLQSVGYAFYETELLPALKRAIKKHTVKHASLKREVLAKEAEYAAYIGYSLEEIYATHQEHQRDGAVLLEGELFSRKGVDTRLLDDGHEVSSSVNGVAHREARTSEAGGE